jgi:hypothetical protein
MPISEIDIDPFHPALRAGTVSFTPTDQQRWYLREVLDICCSDSRFAEKAYDAILLNLLGAVAGSLPASITSLVPSSAEIGDPSFTLHVHGTGFSTGSIINFAGQDEPTTYISNTHVTTGVNMAVWHGADVLPVYIKNPDSTVSNTQMFTFAVTVPGAMKKLVTPITPTPVKK